MSKFKQYKRTGLSEMRPITDKEIQLGYKIADYGISLSETDEENGSPKIDDMIARNPKNHEDQWLIAKKYFEDNLELA